jgi:hypothetical protein
MTSDTLARVIERMRDRERVGLLKYGTTVDRSDLSRLEWLIHFQEELMDGVLYIQRLIDTEYTLTTSQAYGDDIEVS